MSNSASLPLGRDIGASSRLYRSSIERLSPQDRLHKGPRGKVAGRCVDRMASSHHRQHHSSSQTRSLFPSIVGWFPLCRRNSSASGLQRSKADKDQHDREGRKDVGMALGTFSLCHRSGRRSGEGDRRWSLGLSPSRTNKCRTWGWCLWVDCSRDTSIVCPLGFLRRLGSMDGEPPILHSWTIS